MEACFSLCRQSPKVLGSTISRLLGVPGSFGQVLPEKLCSGSAPRPYSINSSLALRRPRKCRANYSNVVNIHRMVFVTISPTILVALEEVRLLDQEGSRNAPGSQKLNDEQSRLDRDVNQAKVTERLGIQRIHNDAEDEQISHVERESEGVSSEPSLSNPKLGNPISHGQVIDLWKELKARSPRPRTLDSLLRGTQVYIPPREPKPEPVSAGLSQPIP
jgi:hypothetical protein